MYDMDISGNASKVSLVFENNKLDGAQKIMQKVMLWLVQANSAQTPYGAGYYDIVRGSNLANVSVLQGQLDIALTNILSSLQATAQADDPEIDDLSGSVLIDESRGDRLQVDITLALSDGFVADDSITIDINEE